MQVSSSTVLKTPGVTKNRIQGSGQQMTAQQAEAIANGLLFSRYATDCDYSDHIKALDYFDYALELYSASPVDQDRIIKKVAADIIYATRNYFLEESDIRVRNQKVARFRAYIVVGKFHYAQYINTGKVLFLKTMLANLMNAAWSIDSFVPRNESLWELFNSQFAKLNVEIDKLKYTVAAALRNSDDYKEILGTIGRSFQYCHDYTMALKYYIQGGNKYDALGLWKKHFRRLIHNPQIIPEDSISLIRSGIQASSVYGPNDPILFKFIETFDACSGEINKDNLRLANGAFEACLALARLKLQPLMYLEKAKTILEKMQLGDKKKANLIQECAKLDSDAEETALHSTFYLFVSDRQTMFARTQYLSLSIASLAEGHKQSGHFRRAIVLYTRMLILSSHIATASQAAQVTEQLIKTKRENAKRTLETIIASHSIKSEYRELARLGLMIATLVEGEKIPPEMTDVYIEAGYKCLSLTSTNATKCFAHYQQGIKEAYNVTIRPAKPADLQLAVTRITALQGKTPVLVPASPITKKDEVIISEKFEQKAVASISDKFEKTIHVLQQDEALSNELKKIFAISTANELKLNYTSDNLTTLARSDDLFSLVMLLRSSNSKFLFWVTTKHEEIERNICLYLKMCLLSFIPDKIKHLPQHFVTTLREQAKTYFLRYEHSLNETTAELAQFALELTRDKSDLTHYMMSNHNLHTDAAVKIIIMSFDDDDKKSPFSRIHGKAGDFFLAQDKQTRLLKQYKMRLGDIYVDNKECPCPRITQYLPQKHPEKVEPVVARSSSRKIQSSPIESKSEEKSLSPLSLADDSRMNVKSDTPVELMRETPALVFA